MSKRYRGIGPADRAIRQGIEKALNRIGADLTGKAQRLAPKDTGALRASADWEVEGAGSFGSATSGPRYSDMSVVVRFNTPYAKKQHEEERYNHNIGQARYLAEPLRQNSGSYKREVEQAIERELRSDL